MRRIRLNFSNHRILDITDCEWKDLCILLLGSHERVTVPPSGLTYGCVHISAGNEFDHRPGDALFDELCRKFDAVLEEAKSKHMEKPNIHKESFQQRLSQLLIDIAQLLDGWHQDGTAWSEWDESVRRRVMEMMIEIDSYDITEPKDELFRRFVNWLRGDDKEFSRWLVEFRDSRCRCTGEHGRTATNGICDACHRTAEWAQ